MSGYEYGNTRLRAMRARLLTRADYSGLMRAPSLDRMLTQLADTAYVAVADTALVRSWGLEGLDRALRSDLAKSLKTMASFYEGPPRERVDLLLNRWDLRNLRTLIRYVAMTPAVIDVGPPLVPAGRLNESELAELARQPSLVELVDLLVAWGVPSPESAFALLRARAEATTEQDIAHLEQAIDRSFVAELDRTLGSNDDRASAVLRAEVDARNLELAFRVRAARLAHEPGLSGAGDVYLPGGLQSQHLWVQVAETDDPETVGALVSGIRLVPGWEGAVAGWMTGNDLATLVDDLQKAITAAARSRFVSGDQLGFDIPVAFTFAKEAEVRNLSLIGRAFVHRLPMAEVEDRLEVAA